MQQLKPELLQEILFQKEEMESLTPSSLAHVFTHEHAHAAACYSYPELTALIGFKTWPWPNIPFEVQDHRNNYIKAIALLLQEIEHLEEK